MIKRLIVLMVVIFLGDCAVPQQDGNLADLHGQVENDVVGIHTGDHIWLALSFGLGQVPKGFEEVLVEPVSGVGRKWQPSGDALPLGFDWNGGPEFKLGHRPCKSRPFLGTGQRQSGPRRPFQQGSRVLTFEQVVWFRTRREVYLGEHNRAV